MGWLVFAGLATAAGTLLWRLRVASVAWPWAAAAALLAAVGYGWQGSPERTAAPARPMVAAAEPLDLDRVAMRDAMLGRFGADNAYAVAGDAMLRAGSPDAAVRALLGGIGTYPRSLGLWTELGSALTIRDGALSPAARFAFTRAAALGPRHPAPPFFLGLAQVGTGRFVAARRSWERAYRLVPPGITYRDDLESRLRLLDRLLASRPNNRS